ncbi:glycosyl hydrolase family 95 catalytic domain-containing protein [Sunxiuqinia sp. sy24]|uniref:glycosyl hydrolase family 95 catalytic domain-containing protein n=1 Tax=Sunxiuqinia sp. sy24 TaxID=3461495 RepID=UPI004045525A
MSPFLKILFALILVVQFFSCQKEELNIAKEVVGKHKVAFTQSPKKIPVPYSVDAPMLGNGFTGVAISGQPEQQVFHIARNDFWRLKNGYNESFPAVLGKVKISIPALKDASYLIEQELFGAKTFSKFSKAGQEVLFKTFVSATEDLMVLEISLTGEDKLSGTVNLQLPDRNDFVENPPLDLVFPAVTDSGKTTNGIYYISRAFKEDVDIPTQATCALNIIGRNSNSFELSQGKTVTIVLAFSSNFKSNDCLQEVKNRLAGIDNKEIKEIELNHEAWWADFWSKSYIDINDSIIEKQYYLSNYSMASFSRDKDFPPSIFGTCITKERPYWNGDYHLNYNHFAPFYGLFSSNHIEQATPCIIPLLAQKERGEYYSKKICGIDGGIMLPVGIGPQGIETTRRNELMEKFRHYTKDGNEEEGGLFFGQKSNSAYCVVNMAMQFYHTYDLEFAKMVYPFVKGVATFWENYLTFEDGRYVIYNDAIHEGTVGTKNPILSLGLVRMVMQTAIDMSKELEVDAERTDKWQYVMDHLSDYSYQERDGKKVFRYTEKGTAWWGDNTLGVQHIYPAGQIGLDSDPELLQVAHNTIDVMQRWIDFNGSNSFFPAAVRVGYNPDTILTKMHKYIEHTYPNGFQLNNPHGIENFSTVPNTINEMLCMGHGGVLRVFPVWPKEKDASFHCLRTYGAFLVSSELKEGQVSFVKIMSEEGKTCIIVNPWPGSKVKVYRNGKDSEILEGERFFLSTEKLENITLKKQL